MNLQVLDAMDHCENATGLTFEEHRRYKTPKEIIGEEALRKLKEAGYAVVQRVKEMPSP